MNETINSKAFWLIPFFAFLLGTLSSCTSIKQSSKYGFTEGYYRSRLFHKKRKKIYVVPGDDSIKVYSAKSLQKSFIDTTKLLKIAFPANNKPREFTSYNFQRKTMDLDVLSVLFKYRPAVSNFPRQLNATFNGALYLGYRTDLYRLHYKQTPLQVYKRDITHYGFSFGAFAGFGTARIDEYVTNNAISIQYDGVVNLAGIAAIIAVDKVSFGLNLGVDHLLDKHRKYWVNEGKPWLGLSVGLNLN